MDSWVSVPEARILSQEATLPDSHICTQIGIVSSQPSTIQNTREHCLDRASGVFAAVVREAATSWRQKSPLSSSVGKGQMTSPLQARRTTQRERVNCPPACQPHWSMLEEGTEVFRVSRASVANRRISFNRPLQKPVRSQRRPERDL